MSEHKELASVGVIGLGQMGILHAAMSSALGYPVKAICDNESLLLKFAKKALPSLNFYSDYSEMLKQENLDAVCICTPAQTHATITHNIIKNNSKVSLFVEKPLARNYEEASDMANNARNTSGVTMVGYQKRFAGVFAKTKELLQGKILGELSFCRCHFLGGTVLGESKGWKFQKGSGGAALEYGAHLLDLLLWFFGEPLSARSMKRSIFSTDVEDYIQSEVEFSSGLKGSLEIGWSMRNYSIPDLSIEAHGKNGSLTVSEDRIIVFLDRAAEGIMEEGTHVFYRSTLGPPVPFLLAHPENVLQEKYFLECVDNRRQPEQSFQNAAKVNKFVDMILSN